MTKNDYYYRVAEWLEDQIEENSLRKKRSDIVKLFSEFWEDRLAKGICGADFASEIAMILRLKYKEHR